MEGLHFAAVLAFMEAGFGKGRSLVLSWKQTPLEPKIEHFKEDPLRPISVLSVELTPRVIGIKQCPRV